MSFSSHRRKLLDETVPFLHRASHARSCALHVANKLGLAREAVIERVAQQSSVSLHQPENAAQLRAALAVLESMRRTKESPDAGQHAGQDQ